MSRQFLRRSVVILRHRSGSSSSSSGSNNDFEEVLQHLQFCIHSLPLTPLIQARVRGPGGEARRDFVYFALASARMLYLSGARLGLLGFLSSMQPSADVLAQATAEVDVSGLRPGGTAVVKWRGRPVFVRRRSAEEAAREAAVPLSLLRDPQTDRERAPDPEWLVVVGVCSHLGCVPIPGAGDLGGFLCPCHGSVYDASGRVRRGPAPSNLEVPPYLLTPEGRLVLGVSGSDTSSLGM